MFLEPSGRQRNCAYTSPGLVPTGQSNETRTRAVLYYRLASASTFNIIVHVTLTEAACLLQAWSTEISRGTWHGVRPQATRRVQIPEQLDNTWLFGESGPEGQLSEGCSLS